MDSLEIPNQHQVQCEFLESVSYFVTNKEIYWPCWLNVVLKIDWSCWTTWSLNAKIIYAWQHLWQQACSKHWRSRGWHVRKSMVKQVPRTLCGTHIAKERATQFFLEITCVKVITTSRSWGATNSNGTISFPVALWIITSIISPLYEAPRGGPHTTLFLLKKISL